MKKILVGCLGILLLICDSVTASPVEVSLLSLYRGGNHLSDSRTSRVRNGFSLQKVELEYDSEVDRGFRMDALLSIQQKSQSRSYEIVPERAYFETLRLPYITARAGKFDLFLGKHNLLVETEFPFIDSPWIHDLLLGGDGLNESGIGAHAAIPAPWGLALDLQFFDPSNEESFNSPSTISMGILGHLSNIWYINDHLKAEWGFSGTRAKNSVSDISTLYGSDFSLKWRLTEWSTEYLAGSRRGFTDPNTGLPTETLSGISSWVVHSLTDRITASGRFDFVGIERSIGNAPGNKQSLLLGYSTSESATIRGQLDRKFRDGELTEYIASVQFRMSIRP